MKPIQWIPAENAIDSSDRLELCEGKSRKTRQIESFPVLGWASILWEQTCTTIQCNHLPARKWLMMRLGCNAQSNYLRLNSFWKPPTSMHNSDTRSTYCHELWHSSCIGRRIAWTQHPPVSEYLRVIKIAAKSLSRMICRGYLKEPLPLPFVAMNRSLGKSSHYGKAIGEDFA